MHNNRIEFFPVSRRTSLSLGRLCVTLDGEASL